MVNKSLSINLLKRKKNDLLDKFFSWALTVGRVLVIITETVALCAFIYRFSLDRKLVDLHDEIESKQVIIQSLKNNEDTYRNLQSRLTYSSQLMQLNSHMIPLLEFIHSSEAPDLNFTTISISKDHIEIEAVVRSVSTLSNFVTNLKSNPAINTVTIEKIENRTSTGTISISVSATIKEI